MLYKSTFFCCALLLAGCSKDTLPKYSLLNSLRILALELNTPEVQLTASGGGAQSVQLSPTLSDLNGSGSLSLQIETCLDRGVSLGAEPSCDGASDKTTTSQTLNFSTPERTETFGPFNLTVTVPTGLLSTYSSAYQFNGVAYLITVTATSGNQTVRSFRRFLISTKTPNQNPTLSDLLADGQTLTSLPSAITSLSFVAGGSPETYQFMKTDGGLSTQVEELETTWFITDGEVDLPRTLSTETTKWTPPSVAPSGRSTVVVGVLRDGRGGVKVLIKRL